MKDRALPVVRYALLAIAAMVGLALAWEYDLLFHSLAELFSVVIAAGIFMVAWNTRRFHANNYLLFVGIAYLFFAIIQTMHLLAYKGMGVFPGYDANLPTQFWIASRGLLAVSLLIAPLFIHRRLPVFLVSIVYGVVTAALLAAAFTRVFPNCFIEGSGLTPFKKICEYAICLLFLAAAGLLWRHRASFDRNVLVLLIAGLLVNTATELLFTFYIDVFDLRNWAGHCLQIVSFFLVYKALIETGLMRPFHLLFRELTEATAEAQSANQAKDQFLAVLSHELRTPLNPALMALSALQRDLPPSSHLQQDLRLIRRNVELEARLIDDLLDLTRIAKGKLKLHLEPVDVHAKIHSAIEICRPDMQAKNLRLALNIAAAHRHTLADPARLQQIFWNLLKNAVKFTPAGRQITVTSRNSADATLLIEVADTGIGIDPTVLPRIFNAFEQGEQSITRTFGGLGLGLAITKALVEMHGGSLRAASAGKDQGATFTVELPLRPVTAGDEAHPPTVADQKPREPAPSGDQRLQILLVEDHEDTARLMARLLRALDYDVHTAHSVESALNAARSRSFDLLISDLGLPDGSGLDLMRQLRRERPLKAIALSGFGMEQDVRASLEAGFIEHLTKPIDLQRLQAAIQRVHPQNQLENNSVLPAARED